MHLQQSVKEFHLKYGLPVCLTDQELIVEDDDGKCNIDYRIDRIREETRELVDACEELYEAINSAIDLEGWIKVRVAHEHVLKEIADVNYVTTGTGVVFGYSVESAERKVHESNMTKTGTVVGGKLIKGAGYIVPNLEEDVYVDD